VLFRRQQVFAHFHPPVILFLTWKKAKAPLLHYDANSSAEQRGDARNGRRAARSRYGLA
jgi:hypothetical protein